MLVGPLLIGLGVVDLHACQTDLAILILSEPQHRVEADRHRPTFF